MLAARRRESDAAGAGGLPAGRAGGPRGTSTATCRGPICRPGRAGVDVVGGNDPERLRHWRVRIADYATAPPPDPVAALALGILFHYFAIASMRGLSLRKGLIEAAKADVASLTAFELGLFGWMALMFFVFFPAPHHLMPDSPTYWFLMQAGMIAGFFTSWPVNSWLIRAGIKEAM
jgi:hypothetical protein